MITVVCVKAKPAYGFQYVNRLYAAVQRHMTIDHKFICFTDDSSGLKCASRNLPKGLTGWWAKLALHRPGVLQGKVLYLDLDTLIVDNIDFVATYAGDFAILRDFYRPDGYGSGVMLWNKPQPQVWNDWKGCDHPLGDQGWMEETVADADRLQDLFPGKFVSLKVHCDTGIAEGAAVICAHGYPKFHDFELDHPVQRLWRGELNPKYNEEQTA